MSQEIKDSVVKLIKKERKKYTRKIKNNIINSEKMSSKSSTSKNKDKSPSPKLSLAEKPRLNETFVDLLERLSTLMAKKGDQIRSRAYSRAQETIMTIDTDITYVEQLKGKPNIGETILEKFKEYLETGTLRLLEREKDNPEYLLSDIYGVGPKKAKDLVEKGIKNISQLRERQDELLNENQKAGLKYYEDILERIPRTEIDEYNSIFQRVFDEIKTPGSEYEIVGSYRRGAMTSGDIDAIITSPNPQLFVDFIEKLKKENIILVLLSFGKTKCLVITKLPNHKYARRVDFMYTSPEEYPFAVLYFTGSKAFNTVMRAHALKMGTSLNEHGLYKKESGKMKEEKVEHIFGNEREIFDYLKLEYKSPQERIDGRSVIITEPLLLNKLQETKTQKPPKEPKPPKTPKEPKPPKTPKEKKSPKTRKIPKPPKEPKPPKQKKSPKTRKVLKEIMKPINENITMQIEELNQNINENQPKINEISELEEIPIVPVIPQETKIEESTIKPKIIKKRTLKLKPPKNDIKLDTQKENKMPINKVKISEKIEEFKKNGISVLENLTEKELEEMIILSNEAYYNTKKPLMNDNEYDIVKEFIQTKYPKNEIVEQVGAQIQGKNKVTLPYNMPSMDKIKPDTNALINWKQKYGGPYLLSCKLDGVSGMFDSEDETPKLYTRGDGKTGQNISHLIPMLGLDKMVNPNKRLVVRGEFIIPKRVFNEKYKSEFANPRNLVSGIINSKTMDSKTKDLHFVSYEIIHPQMKPSEQLKTLQELGYEVVQHRQESDLSNEGLSETLIDWRSNYEYEVDGVIVTDDNIHARKDGNPDYAFAFKMVISDQIAEAKVIDVIWNPSKSGYLKPRVRIEPIKLGGVTIEYATGFNGNFIETNKIGIGAVIQIIRSGDVIPFIKSVTTPAERAKMPTEKYHWTDTHIDIILDSAQDDITVREKNITAFFKGIEVDGLSEGNIKRIMNVGFDTIAKILKMSKDDFKKVEGFKEKMIEKIYNGIHYKIQKASLLTIMAASNMFGRGIGERKIKPILDTYPDILTRNENAEQKIEMLKSIKGIGTENANSFVNNIPNFMAFMKECDLESKISSSGSQPNLNNGVSNTQLENTLEPVDVNHPLYNKHIVMTKVRDQTIIENLKRVGGILDDNVSKNTFVVITKSKDDVSNKTKYAKEHGIPVMIPDEFIKKYFNK